MLLIQLPMHLDLQEQGEEQGVAFQRPRCTRQLLVGVIVESAPEEDADQLFFEVRLRSAGTLLGSVFTRRPLVEYSLRTSVFWAVSKREHFQARN